LIDRNPDPGEIASISNDFSNLEHLEVDFKNLVFETIKGRWGFSVDIRNMRIQEF